MAEEKIHNHNNNNEVMRGCIKRSKGPWVVKRSTKSRGMVTKLRFPSEKERLNNKHRERKRRSITHNIFAGLRAHGNYNLPKNPDSNDLLKALCQEAGWHVDDDGTIYKMNHQGSALAATTTTKTAAVVQNLNLMGAKSGCNYNVEDQDQDYCTCNVDVEENVIRSCSSSQFASESTTQATVAGHDDDDDIELTLSFQLS